MVRTTTPYLYLLHGTFDKCGMNQGLQELTIPRPTRT